MPKVSMRPLREGYLAVGGGHRLYCAEYGNLSSRAAVVVHGGPGSGCNDSMLEWFDLSCQRVVLFDQRGAGKSIPSGLLCLNSTDHLIEDMECLRTALAIPRWIVVGGSWGAALAIAYAGTYPEATEALILRGAFLTTKRELDWFFISLRMLVPQAWADLTAGWTARQRGSPLEYLTQLLHHGTNVEQREAALRWGRYEQAIMGAMTGMQLSESLAYSSGLLAKYRIQSHYLAHGCFMSERKLFRWARQASRVRTTVIHGTHDWICPPLNAARLMRFMPHAQMRWIVNGSHTPADPGIHAALCDAIRENFEACAK